MLIRYVVTQILHLSLIHICKFNTLDAALKHTEEMIRDGADVIDIGGESTRPGHVVISEEEEIARDVYKRQI